MQLVLRRRDVFTVELDEDLVGGFGPGERLAVLVPAPAEPTDRGDEIVDAGDAARLGIGENRSTRDTPAAKRASIDPSTLAELDEFGRRADVP